MSKTSKILIISTIAGIASFWRCKTQFTDVPRELDVGDMGAGDIDRLLDEKNLIVVDKETGKVVSRGRESDKPPTVFTDRAAAEEKNEKGPSPELMDYFIANKVEVEVLFRVRKKQLKKFDEQKPIKVKSEDGIFAEARPEWAHRGDVWVTSIAPVNEGDAWTVCITDTARAASAWLKNKDA